MKRLHIHLTVADLDQSIEFYSQLFGQTPSKEKNNYAKWQLKEPAVNFALSTAGDTYGLNHLGIEVDSPEELTQLKQVAENISDTQGIEQTKTQCCYAISDKYWTLDPQGIPWEHFFTYTESEEFSDPNCCTPLYQSMENSGCCVPNTKTSSECGCVK